MIKVIKPGQKEFSATCAMCGCEFTYEISDLKLSATSGKISCPTCGMDYHHPSRAQDPIIPGGIERLHDITWPPEPIPCTDQDKDPCAECDWMKKLIRDGTYVGDTPCTWCNKNQFTCSTSGDSILQSGFYPVAHLADSASSSTSSSCNAGTIATIHLDVNTNTVTDQADRNYVDAKLQEVYNASGCAAINKCKTGGDKEGKNSCQTN